MLPMPEYSHPRGPLNLVSYLKDNGVKPDLGPKSYVAFGRCLLHKYLSQPPLPSFPACHHVHCDGQSYDAFS